MIQRWVFSASSDFMSLKGLEIWLKAMDMKGTNFPLSFHKELNGLNLFRKSNSAHAENFSLFLTDFFCVV